MCAGKEGSRQDEDMVLQRSSRRAKMQVSEEGKGDEDGAEGGRQGALPRTISQESFPNSPT